MPLGEGGPHEQGGEIEAPPLKMRYSTVIGSSYHNKHCDELFRNVNIADLEWPWTPKIGGFSEIFVVSGCDTHFKSELRQNGWI